jgi:transcriptional regulator with XRE-family HTH domain
MASHKDGWGAKEGALSLHEIRHARARSQEELAQKLKVNQPAVAKLERREDVHVSNLRRYIEALGGKLEIKAHFPDGEVAIRSGQPVNRLRRGK